ncbi:DUF6520 family protein [Pedobacter nutrimenti]|uniref:Secreted protein n=1 Tax=Pedobacter nutrimenti TaxID=1241337 RepID=A0A318UDT8_9SPHI|nr:DUF6520 family protein [Pedobacter nutrimenti]PYF74566.1 hypothetical protein B0O44_10311 [Pedobacter nutrimenti]
MKKLFFSALVAVVAVGGAFASSARFAPNHYTVNAENPDIDCSGGTTSCAVFFGSAWDKPASDASRQLVPLQTLQSEQYIP